MKANSPKQDKRGKNTPKSDLWVKHFGEEQNNIAEIPAEQ